MEGIRIIALLLVTSCAVMIGAVEPFHREKPPPSHANVMMEPQPPTKNFEEDVASVQAVGCSYEFSTARHFCWTYGCSSDRSAWCWRPVYCGDNYDICTDFEDELHELPCWGRCS